MYSSIFSGIIFIEGSYPASKPIKKVEASITGFSAQLQSLNQVKEKMALSAKALGANAITEFEYGQKTPGFWSSFGDNVNWYGKGIAVVLSNQDYQRILVSLSSG